MMMREPMHCEEAHGLLSLHVTGELEGPQALAVESHVAECGVCQAELARERGAVLLRQRAWKQLAGPTPDVWAKLSQEIAGAGAVQTELAPVQTELAPVHSFRSLQPWAWAAAAALVLGAFGLTWQLWQQNAGPSGVPGQPERVAQPDVVAPANPGGKPALTPATTTNPDVLAGGLRRVDPAERSILDEARPWSLEETPATGLRHGSSPMKMAGGQ